MTEINVGANSKITDCLVANPIRFLGKSGLFKFNAVCIATTPPTKKEINETLNYNLVYTKIKEIAKSQHFNLVETLANQIFKYIISFDKITHLSVSISKPDIYEDCEEVGYKISSIED